MALRKTVVEIEIEWDDEVTFRDPATYDWANMIEDWYGPTAPTDADINISAHEYSVVP